MMALKILSALQAFNIDDQAIADMIQFTATSRKDDPERRQGLHGPYEESTLARTGRLPEGYFSNGDPEPWGLLVEESRSAIIWQVIAGVIDRSPEFAGSYLSLALDKSLNDDEYSRELKTLNTDWNKYTSHASDHQHSAMRHIYNKVACPGCTILAALAVRDEGMHALFRQMLPLKVTEREDFLRHQGLLPLLNEAIPKSTAALQLEIS